MLTLNGLCGNLSLRGANSDQESLMRNEKEGTDFYFLYDGTTPFEAGSVSHVGGRSIIDSNANTDVKEEKDGITVLLDPASCSGVSVASTNGDKGSGMAPSCGGSITSTSSN